VAWIVGLALASPPPATAATADLVAYYQAHQGLAIAQSYLANGLTGIILIVFVAAVRSVLQRFEQESSFLANLLFGSGLVVASLSCLEALFTQVLAAHIASTGDGAVIQTLLDLNEGIDTFKLVALALMIISTSWLARRAAVLPGWLVWLGVVEALLLCIASASTLVQASVLTLILYISGIGLLLWTAAVSVVMGWSGRDILSGRALLASSARSDHGPQPGLSAGQDDGAGEQEREGASFQ
jgi:hypothetical protein